MFKDNFKNNIYKIFNINLKILENIFIINFNQ